MQLTKTLQSLLSYPTLDAAWEKVRTNGGCAGGDSVTIAHFQSGAHRRLAALAKQVSQGAYEPCAYRTVDIPKKKGGVRVLRIPSLIDRVLHTALAAVLTPILEPQFEESSFAYRPGRSVKQAVRAIETWRDQGYWHVIEADIVGYFDAVRHDLLLTKLEKALVNVADANALVDLVALILEHQGMECGIQGKGVAQGSPLSPLLANLYLDALDEAIHGRGVRIVRFADDFVVLCKKRKTAQAALDDVTEILDTHGLELHEDGTRILDFDRGFEFLGHLFVRTIVLQQVSDPEEDMVSLLRDVSRDDTTIQDAITTETRAGFDRGDRVIYLDTPGRHLGLRNMSFAVKSAEGHEIAGIAHERVDRIEVGPNATVDWDAVENALATDTEIVLVNGRGGMRGRLTPPSKGPAQLQLAQAEAALDRTGLSCSIARLLVDARISNQRTQLFRLNRRQALPDVVQALASMGRHLRKLPTADSIPSIMGIEGAASADYWPALGLLTMDATHPFRRQRPAKDPLNAAINYLTALLERDIHAAVTAAGLHPGFGMLHTAQDRADAAVYDLMEPFRAPLTEGLATFLFNAKRLRPDMFTLTEEGIRISSPGRRALIAGYEQFVAKRVNAPGRTVRLAWRPMMRRQAQDLAKALRAGDTALFLPYMMEQ